MLETLEHTPHASCKKLLNLHPETEQRIAAYYQRCYVGNDRSDHILVGKIPSEESIILNNNDYLCLSGEATIVESNIAALRNRKDDILASGSFLIGEDRTLQTETKIANYLQAESGKLCQSGWIANVGLIQTIASPKIPVYLDMKAHASLWEGAMAARAHCIPFRHNDISHLEKVLRANGSGVIAVDSVYSTDGSVCPLVDLVNVAERYECVVVVDESHSIGTHGPQGAGLVVQNGLQERVHFRTMSLSKAYAGRGGFVSCPSHFKTYFACESRPAIFSTSILTHELAHFEAVTDVLKTADDRRKNLIKNAQYLRNGLAELGYPVNEGTEQIISLEAGSESRLRILRNALQENDIFGSCFGAPATPKNRSLMRFTLNSSLTMAELNEVLNICESIRDRVDLNNWESVKRQGRRRA